MASAIHQHGSALAILMSPPLWKSFNAGMLCSWSCPCRSGHNVPLSPWQDKRFHLFCHFLSLYKWESTIPFKFRALRIVYALSHLWLFVIPRAATRQAPLTMGVLQASMLGCIAIFFSRRSSQPRDGLRSPALQADSLSSESPGMPTSNIMRFNISSLN